MCKYGPWKLRSCDSYSSFVGTLSSNFTDVAFSIRRGLFWFLLPIDVCIFLFDDEEKEPEPEPDTSVFLCSSGSDLHILFNVNLCIEETQPFPMYYIWISYGSLSNNNSKDYIWS